MESLRIQMFGGLEVRQGRRVRSFPTLKSKTLFAYLVLNRSRLHARDLLMGVFWGERPDKVARKNLRTDLWRLRSLIEPRGVAHGTYLIVRDQQVGFNARAPHSLDLEAFERSVLATGGAGDAPLTPFSVRALTTALALYRGDLLEDTYEDWCLFERERLRSLYRSGLAQLMRYYESRRDWESALACGERLLHCDPLLEHVHRDLMRYHYAMGNRPGALRQFHMCEALLQRELQVAPMPETAALNTLIRDGNPLALPCAPPIVTTGPRAADAPDALIDRALTRLYALESELVAVRGDVRSGIRAVRRIRRRRNGLADADTDSVTR